MNKKITHILNFFSGLIGPVVYIIGIYLVLSNANKIMSGTCCICGDGENECCPCPNTEYVNEVEQWAGHQASSAGSWHDMCDKYKQETNKTFECFK